MDTTAPDKSCLMMAGLLLGSLGLAAGAGVWYLRAPAASDQADEYEGLGYWAWKEKNQREHPLPPLTDAMSQASMLLHDAARQSQRPELFRELVGYIVSGEVKVSDADVVRAFKAPTDFEKGWWLVSRLADDGRLPPPVLALYRDMGGQVAPPSSGSQPTRRAG